MKTRTIFFIILTVSGFIIQSCSKSDDPEPLPAPQYPQLVGTWTGNTSQNDTISVSVASQGSSLIITAYYYGIVSIPNPSNYMRISGGKIGLSVPFPTDNSFVFNAGSTVNDTLKGIFDVTAMTLDGSITCQFVGQPGNPVVTATYTAKKE